MIMNSVTALMTPRTAEGAGRITYDHELCHCTDDVTHR
jgi:hypothetical protein